MSIGKKAVVIASGIATVGAAATVITTFWPKVGWQTPDAHDYDVQESIGRRLDGLFLTVTQNQHEWRCDELQEELDGILARQDAGQGTAQDDSRRTQIEARMLSPLESGGLACGRFED